LPTTLLLQDRIELPEPPVIIVGVRVQARLVELVVTVRVTVPVKPPRACTVIVLVAGLSVFAVTGVGLASSLKSVTLTVTIVEWDRITGVPVIDGVVPVTVTVYVPPGPVQVRVLVPVPPVMVEGLSEHVRPDGDVELVRATLAVKLFNGDTMMPVDPGTPGVVLITVGLAKIWKSTTWTFIVGVV
jgi:hypothetical protein